MIKAEQIDLLLNHRYAHRGLHNKPIIPENSMAAFREAVLEKFGIELDIHLTKDGKLAVIHDSNLKRTCGADVKIEDLTMREAAEYRLEGTGETIPDFEDVLRMVEGRVPLIVELKTEGDNCAKLCETAVEVLDRYEGLFCIESFNPAAVRWLRKNRPDIVRGQLAAALKKSGFKISAIEDFLLKNLLVNFAGKPDFVAYKFEDRKSRAFRRFKGAKFCWTIQSCRDLAEVEKTGAAAIFEKFNPKDCSK